MAVAAMPSCALAVVTRATAQASMSVEVSSARITRVPGTEVLTVGADDGADELTGITGDDEQWGARVGNGPALGRVEAGQEVGGVGHGDAPGLRAEAVRRRHRRRSSGLAAAGASRRGTRLGAGDKRT